MRKSGSLVFYVGNGVVRAALVENEKGRPCRILTTRIRELPHYHERDREHLESRILSEFETLVKEVKAIDLPSIKSRGLSLTTACVVISSPWYISETSVIKMKENKPFQVTDALLNSAEQNIIKAYRDAHEIDVIVLEQKVLHVLMNGYPTTNPLHKKATSLDMTIFTSFARRSSINRIKEIVGDAFHLKEIFTHSQSLVAFSVIGDTWSDITQYIIADITSELTELVAVRRGILSEASSFPMGKQHLIKTIGEELGITSEVALSLITLKNQGTLDSELDVKVSKALGNAKKTWLEQFSKSLSVMSSSSSLPNIFFLFAPKGTLGIFSEFIVSEEYQQFSFAEGKFEVREVNVTDVSRFCSFETGATADLSLALGAIFNNKLKYGYEEEV